MDVRLHRSDRLSERFGHLRIRKVADVPEHNGFSIADRQVGYARRELIDLHVLHRLGFGAGRMVRLAAVQLHEPWLDASHPVPDHVDCDSVEPGTLLQVSDAFGRVGRERAIGADECVLGHILRIVAIAGHRQAGGEDSVLVLVHHPLEKMIDARHHSPRTRLPSVSCNWRLPSGRRPAGGGHLPTGGEAREPSSPLSCNRCIRWRADQRMASCLRAHSAEIRPPMRRSCRGTNRWLSGRHT